jgi:DNA repair protein RadA/Sms
VAVLTNRAGLPFGERDVYASVVGGLRLCEPGSDLGVCLALASAHAGTPLAGDVIACAEVGLGGELRLVGHTPRRLAEAARLGFRRAVVPASAPEVDAPIELLRAASLAEALSLVLSAGLTSRSGRPPPARQEVGALPLR